MIKKTIFNLFKFHIFIFVIVLIITNIILVILNKYALPIIINYVNYDAKRSAIEVLRSTGLAKVNKLLETNKMYELIYNKKGEVESIDFNIPKLNETMITIASEVRKKLKEENNFSKKRIYFVPIGISSNNIMLNNIGPKVPVRVTYKGNVGLDLKSSVKPYGVDSALIQIYVKIEVSQIVFVPFKK